jgi:hypothetical protein
MKEGAKNTGKRVKKDRQGGGRQAKQCKNDRHKWCVMEEGAKNTGKGAKKTWNGAIKRKANGSKKDEMGRKRKARECKITGKGGQFYLSQRLCRHLLSPQVAACTL